MFSDFIADVGKNAEVGLPAVFPVSVGVARGQSDVVVEGANHQTRASVGHETIGNCHIQVEPSAAKHRSR